MKSKSCKHCGGNLVDRVAPLSGRPLRYCPACHMKAKRLAISANPTKVLAQRAVSRALKKQQLVRQPCKVCGDPRGEAHHPDYSKPLDVEWLCRLHHRRLHAAMRKAGANKTRGNAQ